MAPSILRQLDNFYLTPAQLEESPSRKAGIDADTELRLRAYGCDRIARAVILLQLPQVVAATAQILLHRFYCKRDLRQWHMRKLSCAVTWMAVKIEEQTQLVRLRDVVMIFNILQQREEGMERIHLEEPDSEAFKERQKEIATKYEMAVFKALGFICHVDPPHKILASLLGLLYYDPKATHQGGPALPEGLMQTADSCVPVR